MKYANYRDNIKSGDLLAWSHRGFGSWYDLQVQAVRFFTRSEYSHVGVAWVFGGRVFVLESVTGGVRIFPLSRLLPCYHVALPVNWTTDAEEFALSKLGQPYSKWQAILGGLKALRPGEDAQWQCAEYAFEVIEQAGVTLGATVTPSALVEQAMHFSPCVYLEP